MTPARRAIGFAVCLATMLLAVLDQNIVSAATIPIVRDLDPLHGVDRIPWLISAFSLAATAALPLYGKLCDSLGTKRVFLGAVATFLLGSALCGAAQDMDQLIAFRAVQGLGGGGLMSVTMVVIAQLAGAGGRGTGRGAGMGGLVAGAGMALGPVVGGLLAEHADWRWIFYVNLPVGVVVLIASALVLRLPRHGERRRIDFFGAALAAAFSTALLLMTEWGGRDHGWGSPVILGLAGGAVGLLALFLWRQATAAEPLLPLSLFRIRTLRVAFAVQGLVGVALVGSMVYVMLHLQLVRGIDPASAGLFMIPIAIGMAGSGLVTGRLGARGWSEKKSVISGTACAAVATLLLSANGTDTSLWAVRAELLLLGAGFGQTLGQLIVLVQQAAPRHRLGVATTGVRFFQTLGSSLGVAFFGTVLARVYADRGPGGSTSAIPTLRGEAHARAVDAFASSIAVVFLCSTCVLALALLLTLRIPRDADAAGADRSGTRRAGAGGAAHRAGGTTDRRAVSTDGANDARERAACSPDRGSTATDRAFASPARPPR
ncbi:MFS transporter [Streptomyces sp. NPDC059788]|uniref:MFS transporter n=1 Tax=Streptomyces sp. NPDC059788 TaxID=3346948 RepID=UPI003660C35E